MKRTFKKFMTDLLFDDYDLLKKELKELKEESKIEQINNDNMQSIDTFPSTSTEYRDAMKQILYNRFGVASESFGFTKVFSLNKVKTLWIPSKLRFEFLIDEKNEKFILLDLVSNSESIEKIYSFTDIKKYEYLEIESLISGTKFVHAITINIYTNEDLESTAGQNPSIKVRIMPYCKLSKLQKHQERYFELKALADDVIFFLRSIGVSENSNLINQANNRITNCPACNANIVGLKSDVCPYCRGSIPN